MGPQVSACLRISLVTCFPCFFSPGLIQSQCSRLPLDKPIISTKHTFHMKRSWISLFTSKPLHCAAQVWLEGPVVSKFLAQGPLTV